MLKILLNSWFIFLLPLSSLIFIFFQWLDSDWFILFIFVIFAFFSNHIDYSNKIGDYIAESHQ